MRAKSKSLQSFTVCVHFSIAVLRQVTVEKLDVHVISDCKKVGGNMANTDIFLL